MPIQYIQGDATQPGGDGTKILVHVCNDVGGWGKGFVVAISKRWPEPEKEYRRWYRDGFALGDVQMVQVEPELWVANVIGQEGLRTRGGKPPIRYHAIEQALGDVAKFATEKQASVHMPRIGCGLAGGRWEEVEQIIDRTLLQAGLDVTVYDFG